MPQSWLVIGGGLVGLATALELSTRWPHARITLLEKEPGPGRHQSTHNSGVLHAGLYYAPGSLKARLAVEGIRLMTAFCREHDVPHEICGKLVVASDEAERARLTELARRGQANGLQGLRWLEPSEFVTREPHVRGVAAVYVPQEGIVDYARVVDVLARLLSERGVQLAFNAQAVRLYRRAERWIVRTSAGEEHSADGLFNCAGLHCDRVARQAGQRPNLSIVPFRGEYHRLRSGRQDLVNHLVYPVPDPEYPFLGVHFTRLITGGVECGPNAVLAFSREGYRLRDVHLADVAEYASFPGFWRFLSRHKRQATAELWASLSLRRFCTSLQKLVPELTPDDLVPGGSGVRAQALGSGGQLLSDFEILKHEGAVHVLNAPSPAATASLAIAKHLVSLVDDGSRPAQIVSQL